MKKILLFSILISFNLFCQINPSKPFNYDKELEFKSTEKLKKAEVYVYETKIGFENLDSLSQNDFVSKISKVIFNKGKAMEYIEKSRLLSGYSADSTNYKSVFDSNNNLIEQTCYSSSSGTSKNFYEYNSDSTEVTNFYYEKWRKGLKKSDYNSATINFLNKGKTIKAISSDEYTNRYISLVKKYDSKGNTIYSKQYGVETITKYTYNSKGKIIKEYITNNGGLKFLILYKYDYSGNLMQKKYFKNNFNKPKEITTYKYENNTLKSKHISNFLLGNIIKTSRIYTNDSNGNWIEQRIIKNGVLQRVIKRYLTY